jgi:hypothetical protein
MTNAEILYRAATRIFYPQLGKNFAEVPYLPVALLGLAIGHINSPVLSLGTFLLALFMVAYAFNCPLKWKSAPDHLGRAILLGIILATAWMAESAPQAFMKV